MLGTIVKTITPAIMIEDTITHVTVYSNRKLSGLKAIEATRAQLRSLGFIVSDLTYDPSSARSGMVSARIQ